MSGALNQMTRFLLACLALAGARGFDARAQIFTTAPQSLQRIVPAGTARPPAPSEAQPRPAQPLSAPDQPSAAAPPLSAPAPVPAPRVPIMAAPPQPPSASRAAAGPQVQPAQRVESKAAEMNSTETKPAPRQGEPAPVAAPPRPAAAAGAPADVLRHLTNNIQGFRLTGEIGSSEWPLFVTAAQAQLGLRFQVGYLAAVSVMPEASVLSLVINDTPVGRTNIVGTKGIRTVVFNIPAGLVKPGFNSVRLTAEQRHRVDCSLNATYELWTQIDPTLTGLVIPKGDAGVTSIAELAGLPPDEEGALPIRAVLPQKNSLASVERLVHAVQAISLAGRFAQPIVDVGPLADGDYGINLAIGTAGELNEILGGIRLGSINGPRVILLPPSGGRRSLVVATGGNDAEVNEALLQLSVAADVKGSREGLRAAAAFPGLRVLGGQRVQMRELGLASEEFSGRLYRAAFNLIMPPDFYSANYAKANLLLAGGYAPGLGKGAQIIVSINGRNVVSQKLPKSGGDIFKENPVPLTLGSLRPGLNRIEIEAQLPADGDETCDPIAAISGKKRFLFLDSTTIELPTIARIARMPDLAVTATGGYPYQGTAARPILYLPAASREAVGAAITLAAHFAIAAGKVLDFKLSVTDPGPGAGATLVVAPASALDEAYLGSVQLDPRKLAEIWAEKLNAPAMDVREEKLTKYEAMARHRLVLQRNFPASCQMPVPTGGYVGAEKTASRAFDMNPTASIGSPEATGDLYRSWDVALRGEGGIVGDMKNRLFRATGLVSRQFEGAKNWIDQTIDGSYRKPAYSKQASLIVAQNILGSGGDTVRTLVTAANAAQLAQGVECLVDPRVWRQIGGRISVLNASEGEIVEVPSENPRLIPTQPLSIENSRLILAGWFSLNTKIYVELALCLALLLAWTTRRFISAVGRKL